MPNFTILYDEPQEAAWFRSLHPSLNSAKIEAITDVKNEPHVAQVLAYDRPDIILLDNSTPILVVEETIEVPSGHNVGQRFARIAAAAECNVPCLYFGPYMAKKHGGNTAGPRYMNLRLFYAIDKMINSTGTAVTTINWPVDKNCEVRRDKDKDKEVISYISMFLENYTLYGLENIHDSIIKSSIQSELLKKRAEFIDRHVVNPKQYDVPPPSVEIMTHDGFFQTFNLDSKDIVNHKEEVMVYNVGMKMIRSDPYTGAAMLYNYLYDTEASPRNMILWFPNITQKTWETTAQNSNRKDIRLYRIAADAILFKDGLVLKKDL